MSIEGQMCSVAVHQRATVAYNSRREAVRTWVMQDTIDLVFFPKTRSTQMDQGTELESDAVAFVAGDLDIRPEDEDGARDRLLLCPWAYDVIGVWDVGNRGKFKRVTLRRIV